MMEMEEMLQRELEMQDDGSGDEQVEHERVDFWKLWEVLDDDLERKRIKILQVILKLHEPYMYYTKYFTVTREPKGVCKMLYCATCDPGREFDWPCPTVQAIMEVYKA